MHGPSRAAEATVSLDSKAVADHLTWQIGATSEAPGPRAVHSDRYRAGGRKPPAIA